MTKIKPPPGISARLVEILERLRPWDDARGKPLADSAWCEMAKVSPGFWRDLRKGSVPSIDNVERFARSVGLRLSELIEGGEPPALILPNAKEMAGMVAAAQGELEPGTTLADYPRYVGPAILMRLERYVADRRANPDAVMPTVPNTASQSRRSTTRADQA